MKSSNSSHLPPIKAAAVSPCPRAPAELRVPHAIHANVDSEDLDGRADHLEKVFAAVHVYLTAIIADTAHNIPSGTLDRRYLDNSFRDLSADALGVIRNAAEEMREYENWRAS